MKSILKLFLLLLMSLPVHSQDTIYSFWITFNNKASTPYSIENPSEFLSKRAIERRTRYSIPVTESDLPVNPAYITSLKNMDFNVLYTSKWFNAAVITTADSGYISVAEHLSYIRSVMYLSKKKVTPEANHKTLTDKFATESLDYGLAGNQIMIHHGEELHDWGYRGQGMVIAVLDAGFYNVDSLEAFDTLRFHGKILGTRDFVNPGNDVYREHTHGMNVLSIMGGNIPGLLVGTAPEASYWLLRSEDPRSEKKIEEANWIAAAEFADSVGADIINSSLGYSRFDNSWQNYTYEQMDGNSTLVTRGADMAAAKGMLVVVSAGNSGNDTSWLYITAPADGDSVIAVGAVNHYGVYAPFSSIGPSSDGRTKPNVVAIGSGTFVQRPDGSVGPGSGTSFSAPVISGLAACLWQKFREVPNWEIIRALEQSSSLYPYPDNFLGYGIPNMGVANDVLTGYRTLHYSSEMIIYPDPAVSEITVKLPSESNSYIHYEIFDLAGRKTNMSGSVSGSDLGSISIRSLDRISPGIYILKITTGSHTYTAKFVKR